jgi:hypothetical protein
MKEYVPRYINFGNVGINSGDHKEIILRNIITSSFEFEIVPIKVCEAISVDPLLGEVDAFSNKVIVFQFKPTAYGLYVAEYEFRLSEFDYEPFVINVSGTCNVYDKVIADNMIKHMKQFKHKPIDSVEDTNKDKLVLVSQTMASKPTQSVIIETKESSLSKKFKNLRKPTSDVNKNDNFLKTRHYYNLFIKGVTKQIIRLRADKKLKMLQDMIKKNDIKTSDDFEEYMKKDWNNYLTKETQSEDFKVKIKFIAPREIKRTQLYNSNDYNINSLKQDIPHETNINLNEFKEFTPVDRNEIEALSYKGKIYLIRI